MGNREAIVWRRSVHDTGKCECGTVVADGKDPLWRNVEKLKVGETGYIVCAKCRKPVAFTREFTREIGKHWTE